MITDKLEIVFSSTGRKKQMLMTWFLTPQAQWALDANPFLIVDMKLKEKLEGVMFNGRPIADQLKSKYPYLRTILDEPDESESEEDTTAPDTRSDRTEAKATETTDQKPKRRRRTVKPKS